MSMTQDEPVAELSAEECWELLELGEFGRLAYRLVDEVHLVPINYVADRGVLLFRTASGNKLLRGGAALGCRLRDRLARRAGCVVRRRPGSVAASPRGRSKSGRTQARGAMGVGSEVRRRRDHPGERERPPLRAPPPRRRNQLR